MDTIYRGVPPFGPLLWQAEADTELTLSASPTTAVGQKALLHGSLTGPKSSKNGQPIFLS